MENSHKKTNRLIHSLSPYLLQHAHNPVDWYEWGDEAFEKAHKENKLLLVSIGYSACHWCHVMAHECFEDETTAAMMNELFVCIKIDREELPDVDLIYMDACQLVNGSGGWPLNAFALPDKRPLHALTYAPKAQWQNILQSIHRLWKEQPATAVEYAEKLSSGIERMSLPPELSSTGKVSDITAKALDAFKAQYDNVYGGPNRAPKFPMPNNYRFLLQYGEIMHDNDARQMGLFTLQQMALGGIYDAVGGGFARYSVDKKWFAPHFEKMLYDNAQLISLYSYGFALTGNPFFKTIAEDTIAFCERELHSPEGLFYSAYDADSEGIEGLYYTYTFAELEQVLGKDAALFSSYYQCKPEGNWEHGRNILYAISTIEKAADSFNISTEELKALLSRSLQQLKTFRDGRIKPGLDDKCICSWNSLILKALAESALWLNDAGLAKRAAELADRILRTFYQNGTLKRIAKNGTVKIEAFLEDHATLCDALICTYQATFNEFYLLKARDLAEETIARFYNRRHCFFEFNANTEDSLITSKYDISDDVISSGNSMMAHNLWRLSWYFSMPEWKEMAGKMLVAMAPQIGQHAPWYSHWAALQLLEEQGTRQIILAAQDELRDHLPLKSYYRMPNAIFGFAGKESAIPLFNGKNFKGTSLIYPCLDYVCSSPKIYPII